MKKIFILIFFWSSLISAQKGTISGIVFDLETAETMISLPVIIDSLQIATTTDFDGKYSLHISPGNYNILFSYLGYQDQVITDVRVKPNEVTYLDIKMAVANNEMKEVIVSAKSVDRTENALMMLQRKSDKIQDGVSSQEMSRMAGGDVASALRSVTGTSIQDGKYVVVRGLGDRYSIAQLNGLPMPGNDPYRNSVSLDQIPVRLLDNIIASKTFTPDQPGSFTGGSIDIKTKSFPEQRTFSASVSLGYNPQHNLKNDFLSYYGGSGDAFGYGMHSRMRPEILSDSLFKKYGDKNAELSARFGDSLAASVIQQVTQSMNFDFDTIHKKSMMDYGVAMSFGNSYQTGKKSTLGLMIGGSFKQSYEHQPETLQASWYVFDSHAGNLKNSGQYQRTESSENPSLSGFGGLAYKFNDYHSLDFKMMYHHSATKSGIFIMGEDGENIEAPNYKLGRALTWQERDMMQYQVSAEHHFPALGNVELEWRASLVEANRQEPDMRFFSSQFDAETGAHGIPLANVNDPFYFWRSLQDDMKVGAIDITIPVFHQWHDGAKLKVGGLVSYKDRNFDEMRYVVATSPHATKYTGDIQAFFGQDNTGLLRMEELSNGKKKYIIGNFINEATRVENSYAGNENITAAYVMMTLSPIAHLRLIAGARLESTSIFVQSKIVQLIGETPDSTNTGSIDVQNILPSLNLVYALSDKMNLRAGYNQTLARPNLREIAPFASFDPLIDEFFIGNPELSTTDIVNYDLRWEWYPQPGDMFALSCFYKSFDQPISLQYLNASNPEFQYTNVDHGQVRGIEMEFRKALGFISPVLDQFKLSANVTVVGSSMDVVLQSGLEPESRPFEGQSPLLTNISLGYLEVKHDLDIQIAYQFTGERLSVIGLESPDIYERGVSSLDAVVSKRFGQLSLKFAVSNLLDPNITSSSMYFGQEYLTRQFKKGRSFQISLTYDL